MSNFNQAILFVLKNEGGFSNDKSDKGGATNHGISTRFLKQADKDINGDGHVNKKDAVALTKDGAIELYKEFFWDHYRLDELRDIVVSTKALDLFVNLRGKSAGKILQRACNAFYAKTDNELKVDGIAGSKTIHALNEISLFTESKQKLLCSIRKEQALHYEAIVKADRTQKKFLKGWLARAAR